MVRLLFQIYAVNERSQRILSWLKASCFSWISRNWNTNLFSPNVSGKASFGIRYPFDSWTPHQVNKCIRIRFNAIIRSVSFPEWQNAYRCWWIRTVIETYYWCTRSHKDRFLQHFTYMPTLPSTSDDSNTRNSNTRKLWRHVEFIVCDLSLGKSHSRGKGNLNVYLYSKILVMILIIMYIFRHVSKLHSQMLTSLS